MDLETARAVLSAHQQVELEEHVTQQRRFIGRYFKYHNSYSIPDERWWLYAMITSVNQHGYLMGWSFQHTSSDEIRIARNAYLDIRLDSGWTEVEPEEFWTASRALAAMVTTLCQGVQVWAAEVPSKQDAGGGRSYFCPAHCGIVASEKFLIIGHLRAHPECVAKVTASGAPRG
jgi:hypothetical protein